MDAIMDCTPADATSSNVLAPQPVSSARKIGGLKRRINKLRRVIKDYNSAIQQVGEQEFGPEDLDKDDNYFVKMETLQKNVLKAQKMLGILNKKMDFFIKKSDSVQNPEKVNGIDIDEPVDEDPLNDSVDKSKRPIENLAKFDGSGYPSIDRAVTRFINRKKLKDSAGDPHKICCTFYEFPSTFDILKIVRQQNSTSNLQITVESMEILAKKICNDVIELLKKFTVAERKQFLTDFYDVCSENEADDDPALSNVDLAEALARNKAKYLENCVDKLSDTEELTELPELIIRESQTVSATISTQHSQQSALMADDDVINKKTTWLPVITVQSEKSILHENGDQPIVLISSTENSQQSASQARDAINDQQSPKIIEIIDLLDD